MSNPDAIRSMIDSGASLRQLSSCFDHPLEAYEFFASTMQRGFDLPAATALTKCALCGDGEPCACRVDWRAVTHSRATGTAALLMLAVGHITSHHTEVRLVTYHGLCPACAGRTRLRFAGARLLKTGLFACLLVVLLILVPSVVFTFGMLFYARDLVLKLGLWSLGVILLFSLVIWATRWVWAAGVPTPMRQIGRYPFEPVRLRKVEPT